MTLLKILFILSFCHQLFAFDNHLWHNFNQDPSFSSSEQSYSTSEEEYVVTSPKRGIDDPHPSLDTSPTKKLRTLAISIGSPSRKVIKDRPFFADEDLFENNEAVIRQKRQKARILFIGAHTGVPEIDFMHKFFPPEKYKPEEIEITRYDSWVHNTINEEDHTHCYRCLWEKEGYIIDDSVDAQMLHTYHSRGMHEEKYDHIIWIGPTFDLKVADTHKLIRSFVQASKYALKKQGSTIIVQNLDSPIFNNIRQMDGAMEDDEPVSLLGRESHRRDLLDANRLDHILIFKK